MSISDDEVEAAARAMARNDWSLATDAEKDAWEEKHWRRYEDTARLALSAAAKVRAIRGDGEGFGASYIREDDAWHFYTMPGARPFGLVLKGYDRAKLDFVIDALRAASTPAATGGEKE